MVSFVADASMHLIWHVIVKNKLYKIRKVNLCTYWNFKGMMELNKEANVPAGTGSLSSVLVTRRGASPRFAQGHNHEYFM